MRGINSGNMNSAQLATVTAVAFIVAFAPVLCGLAQIKAEPNTGDCTAKTKGAQVVSVNAPDTTVTLKCSNEDKSKITPKFETPNFKVCTDQNCSDQKPLSQYIEEATVEQVVGEITAKVKIKTLPPAAKTFYVRCGGAGEEACYIEVKVAQATSPPVVDGSGQSVVPEGVTGSTGVITPGSPTSCAKPGGAITINITEKGSTAQFTCGDWILYPVAADRVFAEDCKKEESLKGLVRSTQAKVYTLTADKKPPKKKWCFLCAGPTVKPDHLGTASDYCLVHVESSSRTQSSSLIALAAMLPCVLAMLRIT